MQKASGTAKCHKVWPAWLEEPGDGVTAVWCPNRVRVLQLDVSSLANMAASERSTQNWFTAESLFGKDHEKLNRDRLKRRTNKKLLEKL